MWPLLGMFKFDLWGYTAYWYALIVLFLLFLVSRRLINSPFGLSLRGIRENAVRMRAIGAESRPHIRKIYTISAAMAGVAGALLTQTTETVSLGVLDFQRSADILVILILGGAGRLYGGLIGAIIFMVARDWFSGINPQYWYFPIGVLLIAVVLFLPNGILGGLAQLINTERGQRWFGWPPRRRRGGATLVSAPVLATRGLDKSFGSLVVAKDIEIALPHGVRYALIGPNGAGKTTLINLMTGMLRPDGGQILLGGEDITALGPEERVRRGLVRTFQINSLFPHLNPLEAVTLAVCERERIARTWWRPTSDYRAAVDEAYDILKSLMLGAGLLPRDPRAGLRPAAAAGDRAGAGDQAQGAAARRAGGRRAARGKRRAVHRHHQPVAGHHRAVHRARHGAGVPASPAASSSWSAAASWSKARPTRFRPTRACARSISEGRTMAEPLLAFKNVRAGYGEAVVLDDISLRDARARQPRGARAQRRRQEHAAADHDGLHPASPRLDRLARHATSRGSRRTAARAPASAGWRRSARFSPT